MAQTAFGPKRLLSPGGATQAYYGVAGGSGTSTTVTLPGNESITVVCVSGATSATSPFCDTVSANSFTVTTANNDLFAYTAYVKRM